MSNELQAPGVSGTLTIRSIDDLSRVSAMLAKSGYFKDAKDAAQAGVKVLAGMEMGFGAFASMTGIYLIDGKLSVSANLLAQAIKRSGRYDYRIREHTDTACRIVFYEGGEEVGESSFTLEDAKRAGVAGRGPWRSYPQAMLFARALSQGARWHTPDVLGGSPAYVPEELGADVNEDGDVIDTTSVIREAPAPEPEPAVEDAEVLEDTVTPQQVRVIAIALREAELERDEGREFVSYVIGRGVDSVKELTKTEASTFLDAIATEGAEKFTVDAGKLAELLNAFREFTNG